MARIRTIKPEFWTDEKVVQLRFEARLLFIGLWNFADDDGYLVDEPERIKMQVLPADDVDADALVDLLCAVELLTRIDLEDGRTVIQIRHFAEHQKVSHRTPTKFPVNSGKKRTVLAATRRAIATKYGCKPGEALEATCYHCGSPGSIHWHRLSSGRPSGWVSFSGLEIDHFIPEFTGGATSEENLVLSCRYCNRSRGTKGSIEFLSRNAPEDSGVLRPEGNRIEGKGKDTSSLRSEDAASASTGSQLEAELYRRGKTVLGAHAGGQVTKLRKFCNGDLSAAINIIDQAASKGDPREWVAGVLRRTETAKPTEDALFPPEIYRGAL